mgnify:CR=1 FL=1|tara:strand:+ start:198 stop:701 length:504 start_codon:yes stop_codon:yes gene_type:complete
MSSTPYVLRTDNRHFQKVTNDVTTSDADVTSVAVSTSPSGMTCKGANLATLLPIATGNTPADKATFFYVWGISPIADETTWLPVYIGKFKATFGTLNGVANGYPDDTWFFADKIELIDGDTSCRIISSENNTIASVTVDLAGASRLLVTYADSGTQPTKVNCLAGLI